MTITLEIDMLKRPLVIAIIATTLTSAALATKASANGDPALGALLGAGVGAAIGNSVNHHNGAWVGGAICGIACGRRDRERSGCPPRAARASSRCTSDTADTLTV